MKLQVRKTAVGRFLTAALALIGSAILITPTGAQAAPVEQTASFDAAIEQGRSMLNQYWGYYLQDQLTPPGVSWINERGGTRTGCGTLSAVEGIEAGAFYCVRDRIMYLDISYLRQNDALWGNQALFATMAHEYGHHVQNVLHAQPTLSISRELQADCMAGAYLAWLNTTDDFAGRFDRASLARRYYAMGDRPGTRVTALDAHGLGSERQQAFLYGWDHAENGAAVACVGRLSFR